MTRNMNVSAVILAIFVIGIGIKMYLESDAYNLKCIISRVDGNTYCVRERENSNWPLIYWQTLHKI